MTVLVAGAGGGLGGAVVDELARAGYEVERTLGDLLDPTAADESVARTGELEAVVNLVGRFRSGPRVHETTREEFARTVSLNLEPGFNLARAALPRLVERGGGAYVGVAARAALRPFAGAAGYIVGKAAVIAFVQALDAEYGAAGVRCNAVLPSVIDTPANRAAMPTADVSRWVPPQQVARVIRFLVSDESAPVSGAAVPVYGRA